MESTRGPFGSASVRPFGGRGGLLRRALALVLSLACVLVARTSSAHAIVTAKDIFLAPVILIVPAGGVEFAPGATRPVHGLIAFPYQFSLVDGGHVRAVLEPGESFAGPDSEGRVRGSLRYAFACNGMKGWLACGSERSDEPIATFVEAGGGAAMAFESGHAWPMAHVGGGILVPLDRSEGWPVLFVTARATARPARDGPVLLSMESGFSFF